MEATLADTLNFIGNILNPETHKDSLEKMVHKDFGKRKRVTKEDKSKMGSTMHGPLHPAPTREYALRWAKEWLQTKVIGEPESPRFSKLSVDDLKALGYVGLYRSEIAEKLHKDTNNAPGLDLPYPRTVRYVDGVAISVDEEYNAQQAKKKPYNPNKVTDAIYG